MNEEQKQQRTELVIDVLLKNYKTLTRFKGITNTGAGFKIKNDKMTDEICIFIEVEKKRSLDELKDSEIIPSNIENISIDLVERRPYVRHDLIIPIEELNQYQKFRPLVGGSAITNGIENNGSVSIGTLGCIVHVKTKKDNNNSLMSNYHVIYAENAKFGQSIYQPDKEDGTVALVESGVKGDYLDMALAVVTVKGSNEVIEIGTLKGTNPPKAVGQEVQKYGITTHKTKGQITKIGVKPDPNSPFKYLYTGLEIVQGYPAKDPNKKFCDHGDSGAVLVNMDKEVIGLLNGGHDTPPYYSFADDIREMLRELPFSIPAPTSLKQQIFSDSNRLNKYKELLQQTKHGQAALLALINNVQEGINLVNEHRKCMVAWQRYKGPAFISLTRNLDKDEPYKFERSIDGILIEDMISKMARMFKEFGSNSLSEVVERYEDELLSYISKSNTVEEVLELIIKK
ncbi:trypsin-like serine protease [Xanthovirga aplysinae]|uniref:trypsin-like serine protease n=1 Tax=Xanthovirga aplysinae TaxID=2529853 RepID=UPI0012BCA2F4|nr:trypsin-like serine protease [Xanthovirga aplysinae]MTI30316.1 trypsin-like serine protease [Xanthovirga aplysinae]